MVKYFKFTEKRFEGQKVSTDGPLEGLPLYGGSLAPRPEGRNRPSILLLERSRSTDLPLTVVSRHRYRLR